MKAFFYEKSENTPETVVNFGFKSVKTPPENEHLNAFDADLNDIVRNIDFKRVSSEFQSKLVYKEMKVSHISKTFHVRIQRK